MGKNSISTKEIADMIGKTPQTLNHMKHKTPIQYEITVLGALCKKFDIREDELLLLFKMKAELKS